jgi:hypothetical protein
VTREVWNEEGDVFIRRDDAEPVCGEHFCDRCGDCLHCYGDLECYEGDVHRWVQYGEPEPSEEMHGP